VKYQIKSSEITKLITAAANVGPLAFSDRASRTPVKTTTSGATTQRGGSTTDRHAQPMRSRDGRSTGAGVDCSDIGDPVARAFAYSEHSLTNLPSRAERVPSQANAVTGRSTSIHAQ
jgi:hypothetical protein